MAIHTGTCKGKFNVIRFPPKMSTRLKVSSRKCVVSFCQKKNVTISGGSISKWFYLAQDLKSEVQVLL